MGVKTKVFGKFAWLLLEGVGRFYDDYMARETEPLKRVEMMDMVREFFFLVGFVLPCVYCRISYREFINTDINIHQMLILKDGGKQLVYRLHNRVSKKLWDQERAANAHDEVQLQALNEQWFRYCIPYEQALKERFPLTTSHRFWNATLVFLALSLCDYRTEDACYIYRFFWILGRILARVPDPLSAAYAYGLEQTLPLWKQADLSQKLSLRLDIVWVLKNYVFAVHRWEFSRTRASFEDQCREAIVGCGSKKD